MTAPAASIPEPLLAVRGLSKLFPARGAGLIKRTVGYVPAVEDVSFELRPAESLGIVGESGSGKTTLVRCLLRAIEPTRGEIWFRRRDGTCVDLARLAPAALKALRPEMQMIFQDPFSSLNPRMTVRDILAEPLVVNRLAQGRELAERVTDALIRVGLQPEHQERYPHAFSGGQRQRIGIARALIMRPAFVVADEAVSALDVSVQAQVLNLLMDLQDELRLTYLFVAHNLEAVRQVCDRVAVMYAGRVVELAETEAIFTAPQHPYTRALLAAILPLDPEQRLDLDGAAAPDMPVADDGCAYRLRCPRATARCAQERPVLRGLETCSGQVACHYPGT